MYSSYIKQKKIWKIEETVCVCVFFYVYIYVCLKYECNLNG